MGSGAGKVTVTLKLGAKPVDLDPFPCCLCISMTKEGLLRVLSPPSGKSVDAGGRPWMAHEDCARVVPETWVDEVEVDEAGERRAEKVVFGVDGIVKDRWNLVSASTLLAVGPILFTLVFRNAPHAPGRDIKFMVLQSNAQKGNAPGRSTFRVRRWEPQMT